MRSHALFVALLFAAQAALAGSEITVETRRIGAPPEAKPQTSLVSVEGRSVHAEAGNGRHALVYRGEEGVLEVFDHRDQSVFRLDRATARQVSSGVDSARAAAQRLPDAQRRALERLLGVEPEDEKVELRALGRSDRVDGISCRLLEVWHAGARLAEICEGPKGAAGVTPEALAPVRELAVFAAEVGDLLPVAMGGGALEALALVERFEGVPLRVRAWPKDQPPTESRIVRAVPKRFGPERFQAPPGYRPGLGVHLRR